MAKAKKNDATQPTAAEQLQSAAPKSFRDALANVLLEVPKSAQKLVTETTDFIIKSLQTAAHNAIAMGEKLAKVQSSVSEASFSRLINEVWSRMGVSRATLYNWIRNYTVLSVAVPYDVARDALVVVTNGRGLFSTTDGSTTLTGGFTAGIKKHPVPKAGTSYEDCLDWAREVLIIAERAPENQPTIADVLKSARGRFKVMLEGSKKVRANYRVAVEFVVECYRTLEAKSEPLAMAAFEAIEDSSISVSDAGQMALANLKAAQQQATDAAKPKPKERGEVIRHDTPTVAA